MHEPSTNAPAATILPDSQAVAGALATAGVSIDPSELHGALCGFVAGGGRAGTDDWLQRLELEVDGDPHGAAALEALRAATVAQFAAQDFDFALLVPDDEAPLAERADALVAWCRGFLGGFGLAAADPALLSDEASEALQDMARIAASDLAYEESEADEAALSEIVEFVRVAALLLHGDCVLGAHRDRRLH